MSDNHSTRIAVIGIDIGKNSFHVVGLDSRGAIVLRQKWSRGQVEARFANMPPCLIGVEACVGAHHLSRKLKAFGHDARLMPAKYPPIRRWCDSKCCGHLAGAGKEEEVPHKNPGYYTGRSPALRHRPRGITAPPARAWASSYKECLRIRSKPSFTPSSVRSSPVP